ncbi:MAG: hypothetical protein CO189_06410 [candidate division Zixibacteria bacterium CG_4_9_14_3_um_filter_46_8]|nr:MAG: hypothetical protein CO189_06410 [candidate division Zixibacteria bacterium CG_4_9_14_3_um_filter_46_8]
MRKENNKLYYESLELILEGDFRKSHNLLKEWKNLNPDDLKAEILLILFSMREECCRLISGL